MDPGICAQGTRVTGSTDTMVFPANCCIARELTATNPRLAEIADEVARWRTGQTCSEGCLVLHRERGQKARHNA